MEEGGRLVEPSGGAFVPGTERVALWNDAGEGVLLEAPRGPDGAEPAREILSFGHELAGGAGGGMVLVAGAAPVVVRLGNDLSISRIDAAAGTAAKAVPGPAGGGRGLRWAAVSDDGAAVWVLTERGRSCDGALTPAGASWISTTIRAWRPRCARVVTRSSWRVRAER